MKWFLKRLLEALLEVWQDWKLERDYLEALAENERREAEARELAKQAETKERLKNVPAPTTDLDELRRRMSERSPDTK